MNRYEVLESLGDGSFGEVAKARNLKTNEIVAIKKMKSLFPTWEECLQLRELKSLRVLRHENVVQLKEVIRDKEELYFVFEYMHTSLHKVMRHHQRQSQQHSTGTGDDSGSSAAATGSTGPTAGAPGRQQQQQQQLPVGWLSEPQIKSIMYQLFAGLAYMHKHGFFHRDIKPENLLCHDETLKIADLGQAREIRSRPPFTDYVSTRWYRSPELLLRFTTYNSPIDLWACGCIMAELFLQSPLFCGTSEADQLCRICKVLGSPTKENWADGVTTVAQMQFKFPKCAPVPWKNVLPAYTSAAARQLISELLQYDPSKRLTASQAMQHPFFDQQVPRPVALVPLSWVTTPAAAVAPLPSSMLTLPVKADHKASASVSTAATGTGSWAAADTPATSRWWRESSSTLPSMASHGDVLLASSRKNYEGALTTSTSTTSRDKRLDDQRADAKPPLMMVVDPSRHGTSASSKASGSNTHYTSSDTTSSWLSARKWTSPEVEDPDDDDDHDGDGGHNRTNHATTTTTAADYKRAKETKESDTWGDSKTESKHHHEPEWKRNRDQSRQPQQQQQQQPTATTQQDRRMSFKSQDHMLQDLLDEFLA